jgi:hypothetical protein
MTGQAGRGLTKALSTRWAGADPDRSYPGKVVRDIATLAEGGNALPHLKVLEGQVERIDQCGRIVAVSRQVV